MSRYFRFASLFLSLFLCLSAVTFGQATRGRVEGTVRDPNGAVVPGVEVTIASGGTTDGARQDATVGFTRTLTTDEEGFFRALEVPSGFYTLTTAPTGGFGAATVNNVEVILDKTTPVNITLALGTGTNVVDVTNDSAVSIDPTDNKIQTNITSQVAELLPRGTNFTSLLTVAPAVRNEPLAGGFQVDGASGSENTFIIDGQDVTNFRTGSLNINNNLPFQVVQEVQVKSSGFEAEFGGATGGVINVVTKGGANDFHGEFGINFRPAAFQGRNNQFLQLFTTVTPSRAIYVQPYKDQGTDFFPSAVFSGPVVKDRAWFFLAYSPQFINTVRTQDYFNPRTYLSSSTPTPFATERYAQRDKRDYAVARIDADVLTKLRFTGTFTWNPLSRRGIIPAFTEQFTTAVPSFNYGGSIGTLSGPNYYNLRGGRQNANNTAGQLVWTPTDRLVVTARGGYSFLNEKLDSYGVPTVVGQLRNVCSTLSTNIPAEANCAPGTFNTPFAQQQSQDVSIRRTLDADVSYLVENFGGRHQVKGGYQFNGLYNSVFTRSIDTVTIQYGRTINQLSGLPRSILPPTAGAIGAGVLQRFSRAGAASSDNQAFYVQDRWQPINRLSINVGVRTERENVPSFLPGQPSIKFDFQDKIAPRIGGAFDLTGDGKTKIFASFGRFFDRFKYELPRGSFGGEFFRRDYFEVFPGQGAYTSFTTQRIIGSNPDPYGGTCPIPRSTGLSRCQADFRIPSNAGLGFENGGGIDPDIKPFRQTEFTVGAERDLGKGFLFSGRYTRKQVDQAIEDIGFSSPTGSEAYIIGNPGQGLAAEVAQSFGFLPLEPERQYDALEVRVDKRFNKRYYFNANYTFSRLYGNYSGLASSDEPTLGTGRSSPNVSRYFDLPFIGFTATGGPDNGRLPTDRPHAFKFYGAYTLDYAEQFGLGSGNSTEFSAFTTAQSGTPVTSRFQLFSIDTVVLNGRGDLGRTRRFTQTDLAVRHKYRFGRDNRFTFVADLDVLNLFGERNELARFEQISTLNLSGEDIGLSSDPATAEGQFQRRNTLQRINALINDPANAAQLEPRYNQPLIFQNPRNVRFGFRLLF